MHQEEWRTVPGFPDYKLSNLGRLIGPKGKVRSPAPQKSGRIQLGMYRDGTQYTHVLQNLMALTFHGPCPANHTLSCDYSAPLTPESVGWVPKPPRKKSTRTWEEYVDEERVPPAIVRAIRSRHTKGKHKGPNTTRALAEEFELTPSNVHRIVTRKSYNGPQYEPRVAAAPVSVGGCVTGRFSGSVNLEEIEKV